MPKVVKYPRLKTRIRKGKSGQVWVCYYYDMRPEGKTDVALGTDYEKAIQQWDELHNEASTLFSKLCKQQLIKGLEFRDSRATALTLMSRKMDILTLARISRHKNLDLLRSTYYRETAEDIAARI